MALPQIIQGGMGIALSGWPLARAVSRTGQLGVVSGSCLATVLARRLQQGDPHGDLRRALAHFPVPGLADRVLSRYFRPEGLAPGEPFRAVPMDTLRPAAALTELTVLAAFTEVFLAKEGHAGAVGINLLEKIQLPTLPTLYGALLAGVDVVLMGAGIPRAIPPALDRLVRGEPTELEIDVDGAREGEHYVATFDPQAFGHGRLPPLRRPVFLAIVASATLAASLAKHPDGGVDGFVVEGPTAGGHNAPPRGPLALSPSGEPIYGPRDVVDLARLRALGKPFWLAGSYGRPGRLAEALAHGAAGIQVGTAFAISEESGLRPDLKREVLRRSRAGDLRVHTDPLASPTGFPFKVARLEGTAADPVCYAARPRLCDVGLLRRAYRRDDGTLGYRCPSEPVDDYVRKGGRAEDTVGRVCLCNGLLSVVGLAQVRPDGYAEPPLLTAGDDMVEVARFAGTDAPTFRAPDVVHRLLEPASA